MSKIIIITLLSLIILTGASVSALSDEVIIACGGNDEVIIGCLTSDELFFIGGISKPRIVEGDISRGLLWIRERDNFILMLVSIMVTFYVICLTIYLKRREERKNKALNT